MQSVILKDLDFHKFAVILQHLKILFTDVT